VNAGPDLAPRDAAAAQIAKQAGIRHLVKLSSMDVDEVVGAGAWHAQGEHDDAGEELAGRLCQELGARRCRRVVLRDGDALFKDANDALKAGWTRERFDAVLGPI
jgi:hypothetical protein